MKILAIDTSTEACSVAVLNHVAVTEEYCLAPREHNRLVLPMIERVLAGAGVDRTGLDALAFGCGPGSFTGVRIAAGVVQGLSLGLDLPVIPVSTLAALALDAMDTCATERAFASIDARMGEVYWAVYDLAGQDELQLIGAESVCSPENVCIEGDQAGTGTGSGWTTYADTLSAQTGVRLISILPDRFPRAGTIARLAFPMFRQQGRDAASANMTPVYLRDNVAKKPANPFFVG